MTFRQIIRKGSLFEDQMGRAVKHIVELDGNKDWLVQVQEYKRKRSGNQNSFLHAVPLKMICEATGNDIEDVKTFLLGEAFGWQEIEVFGQTRRKPMKRSSELNTAEFTYLIEFIEQWAAHNLDMVIPRPNEYIQE